jgi:guanylate kinase
LPSSTAKQLPVLVITGQSGAGKGTLIKRLLADFSELELAVSATTRPRRPGEVEGRDYYFVSDEEFDRKLDAGEFLEHHVFPWGQRSGTLLSEIERVNGEGRVCVLELETDGSIEVARVVPGAVTIFVTAPIEELERRLEERATESSGEIGERIELAKTQLERAGEFDYVVQNDELERAAGELAGIVRRELAAAGTILQR